MGEPWTTLLTAGLPSIAVAFITYRGLLHKEAIGARLSDASRVDAAARALLDVQMQDNARLRTENGELTRMVSRLMTLARRWCDVAHEMRHARQNDRHRADMALENAGQPRIDWPPVGSLPGFEEIT
jgi:ABC-type transporter Mla MlaB component